jgi:hypothetical protein
MRCVICNDLLTDFEATRKHETTGEYLDTCGTCLSVINEQVHIPTVERVDLLGADDRLDDDTEYFEDEY